MRKFLSAIACTILLSILAGCSRVSMPMLNPEGYVGEAEYELFVIVCAIMLVVLGPVIIGTLWIAWRYRSSAQNPDYAPEFTESKLISGVTLFVPLLTIAVLATLNWIYTHRLDPYRPLGGVEQPYEIQAVSLDYKWLFIYPEAGFAVVNQLVAPAGRPVTIRITSDPMMTSIFIPGLISQIYAMPGMETRANFLADGPDEREGANAQYSGSGFDKQRFVTHIVEPAAFDEWIKGASAGVSLKGAQTAAVEDTLDMVRYKRLAARSEGDPITYFKSVSPSLFQDVVRQYMPHYHMSALPTAAAYAGAK